MLKNEHVEHYIDLYNQGKIKVNKEREQLFEYLYKDVLSREDVFFDTNSINECITFIETFFFPLADFQKFLIPFSFLMQESSDGFVNLFYDSHFYTMGRGSGKNGLISGLCGYYLSPLYKVDEYNISIVANSEKQARTSLEEISSMLDRHEKELGHFFYKNRMSVTGIQTNSTLVARTSNAKSQDGLRDGAVIFDEFHEYVNNELLEVNESGLGKVDYPRVYYIGTNGFQRDGVYDQKFEIAKNILNGTDKYTRMFPWICKLDDLKEIDDFSMWEKANPMFSQPMTKYARNLLNTQKNRYHGIKTGATDKIKFTIKNMNTLIEDTNRTAIPIDELKDATKPYPDTSKFSCIGGCDFAQARDFTACGVLFMDDNEEYIWRHHSFVNQNFLNQFTINAPIEQWEQDGLLTIVDEPLINAQHIVDWFVEMRKENPRLHTIVIDMHKLNTLKAPLEEAGFEVLFIRNPNYMSRKMSDTIERVFAERKIAWGNDYMMRWYTNNVYVTYDKSGNKQYEKKEELRRKTDGFMAMLYAFSYAETNLQKPVPFLMGEINV